MPIKSYLIYPQEGKVDLLETSLHLLSNCEVISPQNSDKVLVMVTDTQTEQEEQQLQRHLASLPIIQQMTLVAGFKE